MIEQRKVWPALLIALAALLPYLGTLQADFVWDDDLLVVDHAYYRDPALFWSFFTRNLIFSPNYFRPVGLLTFFADFQLYGFQPWGYHLTNVLLHAAASALAYLLLRRLLRDSPGWLPFGLALLFAWHPVHVEAVSFVAGRFDLLCTLFYLLELFLGLATWDLTPGPSPTRRGEVILAAGTGLVFLLALGAKETAATFPLVLAACLAWQTSRTTPHASRITPHITRAWPLLLSLALSAIAYLGLRAWGLGYLYVSQPGAGLSVGNPLQHALLVGHSATRYLRLLAFPWGGLSPVHYAELPLSTAVPLNWLGLGLALGLAVTLSWLWLRRVAVAWLWLAFAVTLLPVVNLLPLEVGGGAFVCERFVYLPSFFFLAAAGASGALLARRQDFPGKLTARQWYALAALGAVLLVAGLAGVLTTVPHWRDDVTLWTWAAERAPRSDLPWVNLAVQAGNRGQAQQALEYANRALALDPDNATAHDTAGLALFLLKDYAGAERAFRNGLALQPDDAHLWSNLGGAVREQGRLEEARRILIDLALARDPTLWTAHLGLGLCHLAAGRPDLAVEPFRQAVRYQPQAAETWERLAGALAAAGRGAEASEVMARSPFASPQAWFQLGNALLESGQAAEALLAYDRALAGAEPAAVHLQRSLAFGQLGDLERAEESLRAGLALAPDDGRLHNNLGMVLRERGDPEGTLAAFETAWRLLPGSAVVAGNLAQTYRELGRADEAAEWLARAAQAADKK